MLIISACNPTYTFRINCRCSMYCVSDINALTAP